MVVDNNYNVKMYSDGTYDLSLVITADDNNFNWILKKSLQKLKISNDDKKRLEDNKKIVLDDSTYSIIDNSCNRFFKEVNAGLKVKNRPLLITRKIVDAFIVRNKDDIEININFVGMWR
jgi:hypothetical protein